MQIILKITNEATEYFDQMKERQHTSAIDAATAAAV